MPGGGPGGLAGGAGGMAGGGYGEGGSSGGLAGAGKGYANGESGAKTLLTLGRAIKSIFKLAKAVANGDSLLPAIGVVGPEILAIAKQAYDMGEMECANAGQLIIIKEITVDDIVGIIMDAMEQGIDAAAEEALSDMVSHPEAVTDIISDMGQLLDDAIASLSE